MNEYTTDMEYVQILLIMNYNFLNVMASCKRAEMITCNAAGAALSSRNIHVWHTSVILAAIIFIQ